MCIVLKYREIKKVLRNNGCVILRNDECYNAPKGIFLANIINFILIMSIFVFVFPPFVSEAGIRGTKHDFTIDNTSNPYRFNTKELCVFCHTPHSARNNTPVLWNRSYVPSVSTFKLYQSYTFDSKEDFLGSGKMTSYSLLCLSCHDGTTAINAVIKNPLDLNLNQLSPVKIAATSFSNLSTDLRNDHPVGMVYDDNLVNLDRQTSGALADQLVRPGNDGIVDDGVGKIRLFGANRNRLECTTCHDPHDNSNGKFLVKSNENSQLCRSCHLQ